MRWLHALAAPARLPWLLALLLALGLLGPAQLLRVRIDLLAHDLVSMLASALAGDRADHTDGAAPVIIAIDDASLQALGPWPWPRALHAELIDTLRRAGVQAIGYGVMFAEPSRQPDEDLRLAAAMRAQGRVVLPVLPLRDGAGRPQGQLEPLPLLAGSAAALGHAEAPIDADGRIRGLALQAGSGLRRWEALPLVVQRIAATGSGGAPIAPRSAEVQPGPDQARPWWRHELRLLPGGLLRTHEISAVDLLNDPARSAGLLLGRSVWVGVTATGIDPALPTPGPAGQVELLSTVQWQARVQAALEQGTLVRPLDGAGPGLLTLLPLLGLLLRPLPAGRAATQSLPPMLALAWLLLPWGTAVLLLLTQALWLPIGTLACAGSLGLLLERLMALRMARRGLRQERELALATLQVLGEAVISLDGQRRIVQLNARARQWLGAGAQPGQALEPLLRMPALDRRILLQALDDSRHQTTPLMPDLPLRLMRGTGLADRQLLASIQPLPAPRHDQLVLVLTDLSEVMSAQRQIEHDRQHDRLTGLPERRLFIEQLSQQLGTSAGETHALALLFIDIDRFARIGDHLGHAQADEVLRRLARRLQDGCRRSELLARWGGDQFVLLLRHGTEPEAALARARQLLELVSPDIEVGGLALGLGASIGVACAPRDGRDADTLLMRARSAMGRAKAAGGHRVADGGADPAPPPDPRQLGLETRLRQAIEDDEFVLHYQLQFSLDDGRPVGTEALLRWPREDGLWLPGRFIGLIDEGGMTVALGERVITRAIRQLRRWLDAGLAPLPVSVNVSPRQCLDERLPALITARLAQERVPAALLKIEITESAAMHDPQHLRDLLERLRAMGVRIALDDFGTGYSSLVHLRDMPVDQIKIDPGFVGSMEQHAGSRAIVEATIALAHGLGVPVVAEGVETARQLALLRDLACDQVQGFLLAHPLPPDALAERLRDGSGASDHISRCSPALSPPRIT
ncbi:MAG: hypothetical protein RL654_511 [Pseudomonadota bacterium]